VSAPRLISKPSSSDMVTTEHEETSSMSQQPSAKVKNKQVFTSIIILIKLVLVKFQSESSEKFK